MAADEALSPNKMVETFKRAMKTRETREEAKRFVLEAVQFIVPNGVAPLSYRLDVMLAEHFGGSYHLGDVHKLKGSWVELASWVQALTIRHDVDTSMIDARSPVDAEAEANLLSVARQQREADVGLPATHRHDGQAGGDPLTVKFVEGRYSLRGPYLSKHKLDLPGTIKHKGRKVFAWTELLTLAEKRNADLEK